MSDHNIDSSDNRFPHQFQALKSVLKRRCEVLDTLLLDIGKEAKPFGQFTLVIDWSEVHAYVCGSGLSRQDPLFKLFGADEGTEANRLEGSVVDGAHQAALSFLFEVFPGTAIILPPHVAELQAFVESARRYIDMQEVDEAWLMDLYSQITSKNAAIQTLKKIHIELVEKGFFAGKEPTEDDISALFSELSERYADDIRDWIRRIFSPMFLLGRWMTVNAYKDLVDLLKNESRPPRLRFLKDHEDTCGFYKELCEETHDISFWKEELPYIPDKSQRLVEHDARALAFLQRLNIRLLDQGRQLLFVSRGKDIGDVMSRYPEWFSCVSDQYFSEYDSNEGWNKIGEV